MYLTGRGRDWPNGSVSSWLATGQHVSVDPLEPNSSDLTNVPKYQLRPAAGQTWSGTLTRLTDQCLEFDSTTEKTPFWKTTTFNANAHSLPARTAYFVLKVLSGLQDKTNYWLQWLGIYQFKKIVKGHFLKGFTDAILSANNWGSRLCINCTQKD